MIRVKINEMLEKQGKTKYWLHKTANIQQTNLGKLVNGKTTSVTFENLDKICKALNCDVGDILEYVKED